MSDPLSELRAAFLEECDELLGDLEARLSALRDGSAAADDVNAAFRAIHSVKGGAGAFGLPSLVELAHVFEAALDHLRAGRIALGAAPYGLFFRALDHVASMVAGAREGAPAASAPPDLVAELKRVGLGGPGEGQGQGAVQPAGQGAEQQAAQAAASAPPPEPGRLDIMLAPHRDLFRRAVDLRHLFASLEAFGSLAVAPALDALPTLADVDQTSATCACASGSTQKPRANASPKHSNSPSIRRSTGSSGRSRVKARISSTGRPHEPCRDIARRRRRSRGRAADRDLQRR